MSYVYADYNASYPCSAAHLSAVQTLLLAGQGNPASSHHFGREAKLKLEEARTRVAALFGATRHTISFTSGATEANNWALSSVVAAYWQLNPQASKLPEVLLSAGEHPSLRQPAEYWAKIGRCKLVTVPLLPSGCVDSGALLAAITEATIFVGLIYANNETGVLNPLETLAGAIKARNPAVHLHADAVQAVGKVATQWVGSSLVDTLVLSGHKFGALKGVGCLYLRPGLALEASLRGGGQERGLRSGTENLAGIYSLGLRAKELLAEPQWYAAVQGVADFFLGELQKLKGFCLHGERRLALPGTLNFHLEGVRAEVALLQLDLAGIAVSSGSACSSGVGSPSAVLLGMGYSPWVALNSLRVSFGVESSLADAERIVRVLRQLV